MGSRISWNLGLGMAAVVLIAGLICTPVKVHSQPKETPAEGAAAVFNVNATMEANLKAVIGKRISVTLDSGKILTGTVKIVGPRLLHLERLEAKDFFDALVVIDRIQAIDMRCHND